MGFELGNYPPGERVYQEVQGIYKGSTLNSIKKNLHGACDPSLFDFR